MQKLHKRAAVLWLVALAAVLLLSWLQSLLGSLGSKIFGVLYFFGFLVLIPLTLYLILVGIRFVLRKLFWRVGRRLTLSYLLIGVLPFVFFAILILVIGYIACGVLSQASFRADRQATLNRLDQANLEYVLTGQIPPGSETASLEIYDSRQRTADDLPEWVQSGSYVGMAKRESLPVLISSRSYELPDERRVVALVQPADDHWEEDLESRNNMLMFRMLAKREGEGNFSVSAGDGETTRLEMDPEEDDAEEFFASAWRRRGVLWWDSTPVLADWATGDPTDEQLVMVISYPWANLLRFYFGSSDYLNILMGVIAGISGMLAIVYLLATLLAGGLIYSITRAVNRIEKGTRAVERGDFSYRIGMKRRNQLGDVAQSFDRMTESISSLLTRVAEQERLQSEIDIAAAIQRNLLPKSGPRFQGVSFAAHFEPTASIGGDYYDVFNLDSHRLAVAIGDVSGHGLSTGLVMAMVKAAMSTLVEEKIEETALFRRLNELVFRSTERRAFMTLGFTIFDLQRQTIRHTNAGHLYPYLLRAGEAPRAIEVPSLPLGVRETIEPRTVEVELLEHDTMVYLSDGIVEAQDSHGDPFGFDQLERILAWLTEESAANIQDAILTAVADHTGGRAPDDDATVMVLRFEALLGPARKNQPPWGVEAVE